MGVDFEPGLCRDYAPVRHKGHWDTHPRKAGNQLFHKQYAVKLNLASYQKNHPAIVIHVQAILQVKEHDQP